MKKFTALLLALALCTALAGCQSAPTQPHGSASSGSASGAPAQSKWPAGNINLYCNMAPGGGSDMLTRLLSQAMGKATGVSFAVINDESGGATTAVETVRTADPDGYDLIATNCGIISRMVAGQYAHKLDEFTVLGLFSSPTAEGYGIFVSADSPFQTLDDLVKYAQEHPYELVSGSQASGFTMFMEASLQKQMGFQATIVDVGADSQRILAILGGSNDYSLLATLSASQYVQSGDLRCLAMVGPSRSELIPDAPTMKEFGYEGTEMTNLMFLMGPAGMSQADVDAISTCMKTASGDADLIAGYQKLNVAWNYMTPGESADYLNGVYDEMVDAYAVMQEMGLA